MLSVVHNYYYLLALLIIHSLRTIMCLQIFLLSATFHDWGGRANDPDFSVDLTISTASFQTPEILYTIRSNCYTSQGDPDSSFPYLDFETTSKFGAWKWMWESCQRLRWLLKAAAGWRRGLQYDGKCSFYFNYFSVQLQQTKTSNRKLCIFWCGTVSCPTAVQPVLICQLGDYPGCYIYRKNGLDLD